MENVSKNRKNFPEYVKNLFAWKRFVISTAPLQIMIKDVGYISVL